ncbi:hypothetical protein NNL21_20800 [Paenibacillus mendelii]|nr:hypothetical protein [Paenibacillus mendelii]
MTGISMVLAGTRGYLKEANCTHGVQSMNGVIGWRKPTYRGEAEGDEGEHCRRWLAHPRRVPDVTAAAQSNQHAASNTR